MQFHTKLKTTSTGNNTFVFIPHTKPKNLQCKGIQISGSGRIVYLISGSGRILKIAILYIPKINGFIENLFVVSVYCVSVDNLWFRWFCFSFGVRESRVFVHVWCVFFLLINFGAHHICVHSVRVQRWKLRAIASRNFVSTSLRRRHRKFGVGDHTNVGYAAAA